MANNSLTNLAVVRPKGPRLFAALALLAAIGSVVWLVWLREPGPLGETEHPLKILLVGGDPQIAEGLRPWGFDLEHRELAEVVATVAAEGHDETGPAAALLWADLQGFGYVAFADPASLQFEGIAVANDSVAVTSASRFAVFAVGDLGSKVTVDPAGRGFEVPAGIELLHALFEQEALAATLVGARKVSTNARPLFERIEDATRLKGAYGLAEAKARRWEKERPESLDESEEADPKPLILAGPLERTRAVTLWNGGTLLFRERPQLASAWDDVELRYQGVVEPVYLPPGTTTTDAALPCEALAALPRIVAKNFVWARDKRSALIDQPTTATVWQVGDDATRCDISRLGALPDEADLGLGELGPGGRLAQSSFREDGFAIEIWSPGTNIPQLVAAPGCTQVGAPVWIDEDALAFPCRYLPSLTPDAELVREEATEVAGETPESAPPIPAQVWIYLVDFELSKTVAIEVENALPLLDIPLLPLGVPSARALLVNSDISPSIISAAKGDLHSLLTAPPDTPEALRPPFARESDVVAIPALQLRVRSIDLGAAIGPVVGSPSGTHLSFPVDGGARLGMNIAVLELSSDKLLRLGINRWAAHDDPQFTIDGRHLLFSSTYLDGDEPITVARLATVP